MGWFRYGLPALLLGMVGGMLLFALARRWQGSWLWSWRRPDITDGEMLQHVARLLGAMGYRVYRPTWQDPPFDLVLVDGLGQKRGVFTRHWRTRVDVAVILRVAQSAADMDSPAPMVVTARSYTPGAREVAAGRGIILWTLRDLTAAVGPMNKVPAAGSAWPAFQLVTAPAKVESLTEPDLHGPAGGLSVRPRTARRRWTGERRDGAAPPRCPRCHRPMVQRRGSQGVYWGCSNFPRCPGTRPRL